MHSRLVHPSIVFRALRAVVLTRQDLLAHGMSPRGIAAAVHRGDLIRARVGHYVLPGTHEGIVRATRVGGIAAAVTATSAAGLWVPPGAGTHVWLAANASRLRDARRMRVRAHAPWGGRFQAHWGRLDGPLQPRMGCVPLEDALRQVVEREPRRFAVAILDSALAVGLVRPVDLARIRTRLSPDIRSVIDAADGSAGAGTESIVRQVLRDAGFDPEPQFEVPGVGFVDFRLGSRVLIEVDSQQWHGTAEQQARDYERDLELIARGYIVIRINYHQALYGHRELIAAVVAALATARGYEPAPHQLH